MLLCFSVLRSRVSVLQASDGAFCGDSVAHARTQTASPPQADAAAQSVARRDAGEQSDPLGAFAGGVSEGSHGGELERAMAKVRCALSSARYTHTCPLA